MPELSGNGTVEQEFEALRTELTTAEVDPTRLVTIPILGWTGEGKTCALLTAVHYCDTSIHPISFAIPSSLKDLTLLEEARPEYQGLNLLGVASSTIERFRDLSALFIDTSTWPPGTDEASPYILEVKTIKDTLCHVLFPDLRGGSYREFDQTAQKVLDSADGAVFLVTPEKYEASSTDGKRYRDGILSQLQTFARKSIPVAVMLTQSDRYTAPSSALDGAHKKLTSMIAQLESPDYKIALSRISVTGTTSLGEDNLLPAASERHPEQLLLAWTWVTIKAAVSASKTRSARVPPVGIRSNQVPKPLEAAKAIPELRQIGEYSDSPGTVLCSSSDLVDQTLVTFVTENGELVEATIEPNILASPKFSSVGSLPDWDKQLVQSSYLRGEYFIGPQTMANFIWVGVKGGPLSKTPLPAEMLSWSPISSRRIVAADASGRLHSLILEDGKWVTFDYVAETIGPTPILQCCFLERTSQVLVTNGIDGVGIKCKFDGKFGEKSAMAQNVKYSGTLPALNRQGDCLGLLEDGTATFYRNGKEFAIAVAKDSPGKRFAISEDPSLCAVVTSDLHLVGGATVADKMVKTEAKRSPTLHTDPSGIVWSGSGELLIVSFADKIWRIFKPFGFSGKES